MRRTLLCSTDGLSKKVVVYLRDAVYDECTREHIVCDRPFVRRVRVHAGLASSAGQTVTRMTQRAVTKR